MNAITVEELRQLGDVITCLEIVSLGEQLPSSRKTQIREKIDKLLSHRHHDRESIYELIRLLELFVIPSDDFVPAGSRESGKAAEPPTPRPPRKAGSAKDQLVILAEDDEHLEQFAEYMG